MRIKTLAAAAATVGLLAFTGTMPAAHAQPAPGNSWVMENGQWVWSPHVNVQKSEHYHRLLEHNRGFREARMRKECGPITDPTLHQRCLQSFAEYSPPGGNVPTYATLGEQNYGSSAGPNYGSGAGSNYGTGYGTNYGTSYGR
jgi:hypothetical protein